MRKRMGKMAKTAWVGAALALALAGTAFAAGPKNSFVMGDLGISMEVPTSTAPTGDAYQVAIFFLPAADGFSANVNVQKQRYGDSIEAYDKLSTAQFKQYKFQLIKSQIKGNQAVWEYKGEMEGLKLHWYAKAVKSGGYVLLATGTTLDSRWGQEKAAIVRAVDSFSAP